MKPMICMDVGDVTQGDVTTCYVSLRCRGRLRVVEASSDSNPGIFAIDHVISKHQVSCKTLPNPSAGLD